MSSYIRLKNTKKTTAKHRHPTGAPPHLTKNLHRTFLAPPSFVESLVVLALFSKILLKFPKTEQKKTKNNTREAKYYSILEALVYIW